LLLRSHQRKLLSAIRDRLRETITTQFRPEDVKWKSRDENHYFSFEIDYPSAVGPSAALRPHILIEFTVASLSLPPLKRSVSSFIGELTKTGPEIAVVSCIDPVENAADKISALVWRVPDRVRKPEDDDPDLARHIHDLAALQPLALAHTEFKRLAIYMIQQDDDRCKKITGLSLEKKLQLLIEILESDTEYRNEYTRFVQGMSYATGVVPTYGQAVTRLKELINHIL
jgi:hypothetical protein